MSDQEDNLIPCEKCDTLIERTHQSMFMGMPVMCRRTVCVECEYAETFRTNRLVRGIPYRVPFPRPTLDGKMPAVLRAEIAKMREKQKEG